eukprot:3919638-Alexandrium_andersonii.AAC.1
MDLMCERTARPSGAALTVTALPPQMGIRRGPPYWSRAWISTWFSAGSGSLRASRTPWQPERPRTNPGATPARRGGWGGQAPRLDRRGPSQARPPHR